MLLARLTPFSLSSDQDESPAPSHEQKEYSYLETPLLRRPVVYTARNHVPSTVDVCKVASEDRCSGGEGKLAGEGVRKERQGRKEAK